MRTYSAYHFLNHEGGIRPCCLATFPFSRSATLSLWLNFEVSNHSWTAWSSPMRNMGSRNGTGPPDWTWTIPLCRWWYRATCSISSQFTSWVWLASPLFELQIPCFFFGTISSFRVHCQTISWERLDGYFSTIIKMDSPNPPSSSNIGRTPLPTAFSPNTNSLGYTQTWPNAL